MLAALAVAGAALSGVQPLIVAAAVLAVALGATSARIVYNELIESRVDAARDRAAQASAYNTLAEQRGAEHAEYVAGVRELIATKERALEELEVALSLSQRRVVSVARERNVEERRADQFRARAVEAEERAATAQQRVAELEQEVITLRAELESVTAAWRLAENRRKHA